MPPAGVFGKAASPCFGWHAAARLIGPDGVAVDPAGSFAPVLADRPGGRALACALAGQGRGFRIGGEGAVKAGQGCFETLTGGSLGQARRVVRTQASWIASFAQNAGLFGIGPGVRVAVPGRLSHSLSLYGALEGLHLGAEVHLLDGLRPDRAARALAERRVQVIYATPTHLAQMVAAGVAWPDLARVLVGGAALEDGTRTAVQALAPGAVVQVFYGAAEASFITLTANGAANGTVGLPYPGVELTIRDALGAELANGQQGEVWVRSPYLFLGYAGDGSGSARWQGDWLSVGEIGAMTHGGLLLRGRAGRMVTVAGQNVFPDEIERFLATLPGVERVAVLPVPDDVRGHVLLAVVKGNPAAETGVMLAARKHLGALVAPKRLIWRQDWPELASGKTDLVALAAEVATWR